MQSPVMVSPAAVLGTEARAYKPALVKNEVIEVRQRFGGIFTATNFSL